MTLDTLLDRLQAEGVVLRRNGERLTFLGPPDVVDDQLRAELRRHKPDLLQMLTVDETWRSTRQPPDTAEAFELTDLQQAYLVGEQGLSGQRPAVFHHEYRLVGVDEARLDAALRLIRASRGAMRLAIDPDGRQRVLPPDDDPVLVGVDVTSAHELTSLRTGLLAHLPPLDRGQPYLFRLLRCPDGQRLQMALRLIAFDGVSTLMLLHEITRCYTDPGYRPAPEPATFSDFIAARRRARQGLDHHASLAYWRARAAQLPGPLRWPATDLPIRRDPAADGGVMARRTVRLVARSWEAFQNNARQHGLPAVSALFALFTELAHRWSGEEEGTLTVLLTQRSTGDAQLDQVWGNCAMTTLVVARPVAGSFLERARARQHALYESLEHGAVGGVEIGRIRQRSATSAGSATAGDLVVFTSGIDLLPDSGPGFVLDLPGTSLVSSGLSTPQVALDHQVDIERGELVCTTDFDPSAFSPTLVDSFGAAYSQALRELAADPARWTAAEAVRVAPGELTARQWRNTTARQFPAFSLDQPVLDRARAQPQRVAIVDEHGSLEYGELLIRVTALAARLTALGVRRGDLVGLHLARSREQTLTALAVQQVGAAYLPTDLSWPAARVKAVLEHSGAVALVSAPADGGLEVVAVAGTGATTFRRRSVSAGARSLDDLGYVIYTSGSTGTPKGVAMTHRATANTISTLIDDFALGPDDAVLGVSSIAFDLSVFDIFATLRAGGRLVLPPSAPTPSPDAWAGLIRAQQVTVWNSVPQLMRLLLEYLGEAAADTLAGLRVVMLSGDWVPPELVADLRRVAPAAAVHSLGGATEAAIWSNSFDTAALPATGWSSIPYGYPLANQRMHVLHQDGSDVPVWVPGDLYIAGAGLAAGYLNDPQRTAESFVEDPRLGRMYRTGDRARYRPGGVLEFLGRQDGQVKIGGFRIELGEVEAVLREDEWVTAAVAVVLESVGSRTLEAAVLARHAEGPMSATPRPDSHPARLRAALAEQLPPYMVPKTVTVLAELPLSGNGKVDRKAVIRLLQSRPGQRGPEPAPPRPLSEPETRLAGLWREVVSGLDTDPGPDADFFSCGGNSLSVVRLVNRIRRVLGQEIPLNTVFEHRTLATMAAVLGSARGPDPLLATLRPGNSRHVVLPHPVGGNIACYVPLADGLAEELGHEWAFHVVRAPGLVAGETAASELDDLAARLTQEVLTGVPDGEVHLVGWSMGGMLARLLCGRLRAAGRSVPTVVAIDSYTPAGQGAPSEREAVAAFFDDLTQGAPVRALLTGRPDAGIAALVADQDRLVAAGHLAEPLEVEQLQRLFQVHRANFAALATYPGFQDSPPPTLAVTAQTRRVFNRLEACPDGDETWTVLGTDHFTIMDRPATGELVRVISEHLRRLSEETT
jgi:amino acid adenylation domain-containing protein